MEPNNIIFEGAMYANMAHSFFNQIEWKAHDSNKNKWIKTASSCLTESIYILVVKHKKNMSRMITISDPSIYPNDYLGRITKASRKKKCSIKNKSIATKALF